MSKTIKRRIVITGLGVVAPNGIGKDEFWKANVEGKSGVDTIKGVDTSAIGVNIAGQVSNFDPCLYIDEEVVKRTDRFVHFGMASTGMALKDSQLDLEKEDRKAIGVIIGSGVGGLLYHDEQLKVFFERGLSRLNPLSVPRITPNAVSSHIAIHFGLFGHNMVISTACASGAHAIGEAFRKIQNGEIDICIAGGVEAPLTPLTYGAYAALRVLSTRNDAPCKASRPFDGKRDGFVLSEGAGILVLEELEHALGRNAPIYAEVRGYGANSGGHHIVMPMPNGEDAADAMRSAMRDAGREPKDIDYINAHGTSTLANDQAETRAIKTAFGDQAYRIPVSSTKSMIGHTIGAAGAIEAVVCALVVKNDLIPPTINYQEPDPECDLDYVPNQSRASRIKNVLSNSFGFGSCNACILFTKEGLE